MIIGGAQIFGKATALRSDDEDIRKSHHGRPQGCRTEAKGSRGAIAARRRPRVWAPYLNDVEHDRGNPPENALLHQLADLLRISADVLYFYARRLPSDLERDFDSQAIEAACRAYRRALNRKYTARVKIHAPISRAGSSRREYSRRQTAKSSERVTACGRQIAPAGSCARAPFHQETESLR